MVWSVVHEFCLKSAEIRIPFVGTDKEAEDRFANLADSISGLKLYKKVEGKAKDVTPPRPVRRKKPQKLIYQHN